MLAGAMINLVRRSRIAALSLFATTYALALLAEWFMLAGRSLPAPITLSAGVISGSTNAFGALARAALRAGPEARAAAMDRVRQARDVAGRFPMMAAMKQIEAWRSGDESWERLLPPLMSLGAAERDALKAALSGLDSA